jgi:glycosyltransferase involved in cell wall biosynthesis
MRVVMINDCAFVGETLLKHMPSSIEKLHIKRNRGFWSKTFGLSLKILKAQGDLYHAHYLLQDCYIADRLGRKPLVGHCHGSDVRTSIHHPLWGRIVRHNLKSCSKVLVSTPDIVDLAKRFREDAEYLPNLVDSELFYPKPVMHHEGKKRVLIASDSNWSVKGTDIAIKALSKIKSEVEVNIIAYGTDFRKTVALASSLGLHMNQLPKTTHEKLNQYYWSADVVIDRFKLGSLGVVSLEAIACGRPVVTYVSSEFPEQTGFPLKDIIAEKDIAKSLEEAGDDLWHEEHEFMAKEHNVIAVLPRLLKIYESLVEV